MKINSKRLKQDTGGNISPLPKHYREILLLVENDAENDAYVNVLLTPYTMMFLIFFFLFN